jgi:transcriptional regulator with XRE-family HTH domain
MHSYITTLRKQAKISQEQIAQRLNISRPTYITIEKGQRELKASEAQQLAQIFDISVQDFLAKKEPNKHQAETISNTDQAQKFKEVLLYILQKIGAKPNVGQTVIYKLLYFIDFDYYEKYDEKILGLAYQRNHHGPTPIAFAKIVEEMKRDGDLEEVKSKFFSFDQKKYLPRREADLDKVKISIRELEMIKEVIRKYSDKTATWLSEYSHKDIPCASHDQGEIIDYQTVFYRNDPYSVREYDDERLDAVDELEITKRYHEACAETKEEKGISLQQLKEKSKL